MARNSSSQRYNSITSTMSKYEPGDYVKVEFEGEGGMPGEWMWVRVSRSDDEKRLVFGTLDNEPLGDYGRQAQARIRARSELCEDSGASKATILRHLHRSTFAYKEFGGRPKGSRQLFLEQVVGSPRIVYLV